MKIKLMDYMDRVKEFEIGDLENILRIDIQVISGDEIAIITYINGDKTELDSCDSDIRYDYYYDDKYCIYNKYGENKLEEFCKRKSIYDILKGV